jgi:hypothetical protein
MSAADPIAAVPADVVSRLGHSPAAMGRFGSSRVLVGSGFVLKAGPEDRAAREAFVLGELQGLPLRVPRLLEAGEGWLLLEAVEVAESDVVLWRDAALADLARLHESFAEKLELNDLRLRSVTAAEFARLSERAVALGGQLGLPGPLRVLVADPEPLLAEVQGTRTLVHGDAWPGNVLRTIDGGRCWIDWEEAGAGHPALDLATWLHGSPWVPPADDPERDLAVYLEARTDGANEPRLRRAVEAAVVLLFLLLDLPGLAEWDCDARREIVERRAATAERFVP